MGFLTSHCYEWSSQSRDANLIFYSANRLFVCSSRASVFIVFKYCYFWICNITKMECTQKLECTQELYDTFTERTCPEQVSCVFVINNVFTRSIRLSHNLLSLCYVSNELTIFIIPNLYIVESYLQMNFLV